MSRNVLSYYGLSSLKLNLFMERALTVGRICIVSFIAGLLAIGHASLKRSDRRRRPFCSAQTTRSLVKDKLPAKACSFPFTQWGLEFSPGQPIYGI